MKLALDSKFVYNFICKNEYHMPKIYELVIDVAAKLSAKSDEDTWSTKIKIKNSQLAFSSILQAKKAVLASYGAI